MIDGPICISTLLYMPSDARHLDLGTVRTASVLFSFNPVWLPGLCSFFNLLYIYTCSWFSVGHDFSEAVHPILASRATKLNETEE